MKRKKKNRTIICEIEAAHNKETGNCLSYTVDGLASSIHSWTSPYLKPFILFHEDQTGKCIGRVTKAEIRDSIKLPGYKALVLTVRVTDGEGIRGIIDRRYLTVSIGAKSKKVECSICHKFIHNPKDPCHTLGQYYGRNRCNWIIHEMTAEELSAVIVPSDKYAQIINWYYEDEPNQVYHFTESLDSNEENITIKKLVSPERIDNMGDVIKAKDVNTQTSTDIKEKQNAPKEEVEGEEKDFLIKENARLQNELEAFVIENGILKKRVDLLQQDLATEKQNREASETLLASYKLKERQNIVSNFISIREKLNLRPLKQEELESKSIEYLEASIQDMQEDLIFKESQNTQQTVEDSSTHLKDLKTTNQDIKIEEKQDEKEDSLAISRVNSIMSHLI